MFEYIPNTYDLSSVTPTFEVVLDIVATCVFTAIDGFIRIGFSPLGFAAMGIFIFAVYAFRASGSDSLTE